ncbi:UEV-domain-containing protein [Tuber magnatum]|uniref:UEV-domain-containing protein n=1 Tax=Tuber magnatum TaxID=42249 RepID=A0A317SLK7_9PEZI|nr:UEV-domain-containing protein [Tuber magnatum]
MTTPVNHKLTPQVQQWLHRVIAPEYADPQRAYNDVATALFNTPSLSPRTEVYTHEDGRPELLLHLHGTIPVLFRGATYNIPLTIWLPHTYPRQPPMAFVTPAKDMLIRPGNHVDPSGRCYHPYLANWINYSDRSNIVDLCDVLRGVFGREPPVYSKTAPPVVRPAEGDDSPPPPPLPPLPPVPPHPNAQQQPQQRPLPPGENTNGQGRGAPGGYIGGPPPPPLPPAPHRASGTPQLQAPPYNPSGGPGPYPPPSFRQTISNLERRPHNLLTRISAALHTLATASHTNLTTATLPQVITQRDSLTRAQSHMTQELQDLARLHALCAQDGEILKERIAAAEGVIHDAEDREVPGVDAVVVGVTVVHAQLYELVTEDRAIEDTIYVLGKALDRERISLEVFLKHTRTLAREQFLLRALVKKIIGQIGIEE